MPVNQEAYQRISAALQQKNVTLVAVSKTKPTADILELYQAGQKDFGENYVQELVEKQKQLPAGIRWHFIGHLQSNKVKNIAPFVHLIQGVDSFKLLTEINRQAEKNQRVIGCLLQVHIAVEETKFGFNEEELENLLVTRSKDLDEFKNIRVEGLMGMASFTDDREKVRNEFRHLHRLFTKFSSSLIPRAGSPTLSMGMSGDYELAIEEGSNMVRIGSLLFGSRD